MLRNVLRSMRTVGGSCTVLVFSRRHSHGGGEGAAKRGTVSSAANAPESSSGSQSTGWLLPRHDRAAWQKLGLQALRIGITAAQHLIPSLAMPGLLTWSTCTRKV